MPTTTRAFRAWQDRIESGVMSKAQCQQYARAVVAIANGQMAGGHRTTLAQNEAGALRMLMLLNNGVRLTDEHTAQGLAWMARHRDTFPAPCFDRFSHFTYPGDAYDVNQGEHYRPYLVPIWRIHTVDGDWLDYTASPWQSGRIGPVIFRRHDQHAA